MIRPIVAIIAISFLLSVRGYPDTVDDFVRRQMARNQIPGAAVAIVKDGKLVKVAAYGVANLDWDNVVTGDTMFQIASTTKPFTGLLLMSFVRDGKIQLDASVRTYLPEAPVSWQKITVRMLATHSSGLKFDLGAKKINSVDEAVTEAYTLPLDYEPGAESRYGLTDFVVLTKILETVGGRSYPILLRERVLEPLGLRDSAFDNMDEGRSWDPVRYRVTTYRWTGNGQRAYAFYYPSWTYNAGGLFSSAKELSNLLLAISEQKYLSAELLNQMWTPMTLKSGQPGSFALGWTAHKYRGLRVVGHSGGPALSDIAYFPDLKLGVVVLTNQQRLFPLLAESIANFYLPADARADDPKIDDPSPKTTEMLRDFITGLSSGRSEANLFSAEAQKTVLPAIQDFGPVIVNQLEPLSRMYLIERKVNGTETRLLYRVYFGERPMKWRFVLDREGKITDLEPSSAD
jgi:CubicO group peptidase (beta-lactamase class C family)